MQRGKLVLSCVASVNDSQRPSCSPDPVLRVASGQNLSDFNEPHTCPPPAQSLPSSVSFLWRGPTRWALPCACAAFLSFPQTISFGGKEQSASLGSSTITQSCCYRHPGRTWEWSLSVSVLMGIPQGCVSCFGLLPAPLGRVFPCRVCAVCVLPCSQGDRYSYHILLPGHLKWALQHSAHVFQQVKATERGRTTKYLVLEQRIGGPAGVSRTGKPRTGPRLSWISPAQVPCWDNVEYCRSEIRWLPHWAAFLPANPGMNLESLHRETKVEEKCWLEVERWGNSPTSASAHNPPPLLTAA